MSLLPSTQREKEIRKKRLHFGLVFQNFNLFPQYTALQNVTLARELMAKEHGGETKAQIEAHGMELLEQMAPINKTADKKLDAYVYRIIGRWKDARGVEYVFRRDGSCAIAGEEGYFGGSGYDIFIGPQKYPTTGAYSVVSLRNKTLTLKNLDTGSTVRLSYLGEPETENEE